MTKDWVETQFIHPEYPPVNQWFAQNPGFLLGEITTNRLRSSNGGVVQTIALVKRPNQDVIKDLRMALANILNGDKSMIDADKFSSNSPYCFILQYNERQIDIHFPPDATPAEKLLNQLNIAGFKKNSDCSYSTGYSTELAQKAKSWVEKCKEFGAIEVAEGEDLVIRRGKRMFDGIREVIKEEIAVLKEELRQEVLAEVEKLQEENKRLAQSAEFHKREAEALRSHVEELKAQCVEIQNTSASQLKAIQQEWGITPPPEPIFDEPDLEEAAVVEPALEEADSEGFDLESL